ncbi:MAG TPA: response regulator transcription factor [Nitriliruptorales bacterium]
MAATAAGDKGQPIVDLVVVDPDELRREGLATIARRSSRVKVVATSGSVAGLPRLRKSTVAAFAMPDGPWPGPQVLPKVRTFVFSDRFTDAEVLRVLGGGAKGVLRTPCTTVDLEHAAHSIALGRTWIDPMLANRVVAAASRGQRAPGGHGLTSQEQRALVLLPRGLTNREIGEEMGISHETVKTHLRNAFAKIGARNRHHAARIVTERGLDET